MEYTIKNLAKKFNVSESGLRGIIYNKKLLPYKKVGSRVYVTDEDYLSYKSKLGVESITNEEVQNWYNDYCTNLTFKDIAKKYNRCERTISKFLKERFNVTSRSYFERLDNDTILIYNKAYREYIDMKGKSLTQIVKDYNFEHPHTFINYVKHCGLKIKSLSEVSRFIGDENFFDIIDSEIKAYLLGFFAADGHIEKRKDYDSYTLRVGVQLNDYHILKLYTKYISQETVISCKKNMATIAITSKKIGEDLLKLGYDNQKTYTAKKLPCLDEHVMRHFIRGYFDGDGSVILRARRVRNRLSGYNREFSITAFNKSVLDDIASYLKVNCKIEEKSPIVHTLKGRKANFKTSYSLVVNSKESLEKIYNYLYDNATFFFKRKRDKFELCFLDTNKIEAALQGNL